jgi:2'-5' RNA ligase
VKHPPGDIKENDKTTDLRLSPSPHLRISESRWRVFCAIDLPDNVRERSMRHIARLRDASPQTQASWSRDQIHLTLKFLGEIAKSRVEILSQAASRSVEGLSSFEVFVEETGAFPKHGPPRVLWIGVTDAGGKLAEIHARLEEECTHAGFAKEERPFHPHLTLARLRNPQGARTLASAHKELGFERVAVTVSELLVMRSELSNEGSKHTVISRHLLRALDQ